MTHTMTLQRRLPVRADVTSVGEVQKPVNTVTKASLGNFALPYRKDTPAEVFECSPILRISDDVSGNLRTPILLIRSWLVTSAATVMLMPEASMNEDDGVMLWKDHIGSSW